MCHADPFVRNNFAAMIMSKPSYNFLQHGDDARIFARVNFLIGFSVEA